MAGHRRGRDRILVVESNEERLAHLVRALSNDRRDPVEVREAVTLQDARQVLRRCACHVVLFSCGMRDGPSIQSFCSRLRRHATRAGTGLVILDRTSQPHGSLSAIPEADLVIASEGLSPAALRNALRGIRAIVHERYPMNVSLHGVTLHADTRRIQVPGREAYLAPCPFNVLYLLFSRAGDVLDYRTLLDAPADMKLDRAKCRLRPLISKARKALGSEREHLIHAVYGLGYQVPPPPPEEEGDF